MWFDMVGAYKRHIIRKRYNRLIKQIEDSIDDLFLALEYTKDESKRTVYLEMITNHRKRMRRLLIEKSNLLDKE